MNCPNCEAELPRDADVCDNCGQEFCPHCHKPVPARSTACLTCGETWSLACPECGHEIAALDTKCPHCGLSFKEEFEHEELITDRYAASTPAPRPVLQSPTAFPPADLAETPAINTAADQRELAETPLAAANNDAEIAQNKPRPIAAPRRREYSRLFAKLLQGTSP